MKRIFRVILPVLLACVTALMMTACGSATEKAATAATEDFSGVLMTAAAGRSTEPPAGRTEKPAAKSTAEPEEPGPIIEPQAIADYIFIHGELPDNFITKKVAQALGWDSSRNYVSDVAPGKSIGGDRFGNYEQRLPQVKGRKYFEADCYYTKGKRRAERIVYSNDGHVWYTEDHYVTFTELFPSPEETEAEESE